MKKVTSLRFKYSVQESDILKEMEAILSEYMSYPEEAYVGLCLVNTLFQLLIEKNVTEVGEREGDND